MPGQIRQSSPAIEQPGVHQQLDTTTNLIPVRFVQVARVEMDRNFKSAARQVTNRLFRTENCVKNKFYGGLRKTVRSLNMLYRSACHKSKKEIKFKSIMRIFEYAEGRYRHQTALF